MAYSTLDDLKNKIDEAALIQLTDTAGSGAVDAARAERAIRDADALIDSYVGKVYKVPMNPVPHIVTDVSAALAVFNLHMFRSVDSPVWNGAREKALSFLREVAEGKAALEGAVAEPQAADDTAGAAYFDAQDRRFSRGLLKGM